MHPVLPAAVGQRVGSNRTRFVGQWPVLAAPTGRSSDAAGAAATCCLPDARTQSAAKVCAVVGLLGGLPQQGLGLVAVTRRQDHAGEPQLVKGLVAVDLRRSATLGLDRLLPGTALIDRRRWGGFRATHENSTRNAGQHEPS